LRRRREEEEERKEIDGSGDEGVYRKEGNGGRERREGKSCAVKKFSPGSNKIIAQNKKIIMHLFYSNHPDA
jgi:hypothetical protein